GRVNRTGQVVLPEYDQLVADIPAEKRPAAVLAKKMASLNANTTASRSSAVTAKDVPDFINEYGDEVAASWVRDNMDTHFRLASPVKISEEGKLDPIDAMRKLTGRLPLLPLDQQEAIYDALESEYKALIAQLEASGENALEAQSFDLKAKLIERMEVQGKRNDSGSPFAAPVILQKVSIARLGKPFKPSEVMSRLAEAVGGTNEGIDQFDIGTLSNMLQNFNTPHGIWGKPAFQREATERRDGLKRFSDYTRPVIDGEETPEGRTKQMNKFNEQKDRWTAVHQMLPIGRRVVLKTATSNLTAIVLDVKQQGEPKNPLALGSWKATFAIADASRQMTIPFSRLTENGKSTPDSALDIEVEPMTDWYERYEATLQKFEHMQSEAREERYIAGGNMLAAYDWLDLKGAIINYTSDKGTIHQGIMTARGFDPGKQSIAHGRIEKNGAKIKEYLDETLDRVWSRDGNVALQKDGRYGQDYVVTAQKAKAKGGVYYLDPELTRLTGDFVSNGGNMVAYLPRDKFVAGVERMMKFGAEFKMAASKITVEKPTEGDEPTLAAAMTGPNSITPAETEKVQAAVRKAMEHIIGKHATVGFMDQPAQLPDDAKAMWGGNGAVSIAYYKPWQKLVMFSMDTNLPMLAAHEGYHVIEYQLQTPAERSLMERETPAIRQKIKPYAEERYNLTADQIDSLAGEEVRAIGSEAYADQRIKAELHIGVRRWYEKVLEFMRRIRGAVRAALGTQRADDIYRKAYDGGYADATGDTPRPEANSTLAAIRPGGSRNAVPSMSETVAEHLRDRGYDRMAGLSQKLGIGNVNATEIRVKLQDKMARIRNAEESVGGVPSQISAYQAESLYFGRTGERLERLEKDRFDPLIKAMHAADISMGEMNAFLYARHAKERNAYIDTINPGLNGEGSGMSDADADAIMMGVGANRIGDFDRIAAMVDQINSDTRDTLVSYGLISQDTADAWASQYQHYVPLRGFAEGTEDEGLIGRGKGYDTRGKEVKAAFGRRSEAEGPLQYVMMQAESAIVRGEKNRVGNTFLRFVRANPNADRWQVNAPTLKRKIDPRTGLVTYYADFNYHNEPDAFVTKVGGKPMVIRLYGKDGINIARALKQMGATNMNAVVKVLHTLTTLQSRLSTQWNPNFTIPNFARDLGESFINLQAQDQQRFVTQFAQHLFPAMKGAFQALAGQTGGPYAAAFREFDKAGGRIRFFGLDDPDDIKRNVTRKMRKLEGGALNTALGAGHAVAEGFEIVNGAVENAPRLAAYMAARDVGMSAPDAAMLARNLTVDFNKKGEWGPAINSAYMFANASIQGGARLGRAMMHKRVRQAAYALAAAGAMGALYNILAGDSKDYSRYCLCCRSFARSG
ncbi:strawberry notch C-terminal domain-containing protein, partial [Sphingomonas sp.]|uniref:strawberry notch C-terminal domain-containing protein n=1 Tax=Sphingomonas sp. TaxID=28214 RepID=UPI0025D6B7AC